MRRILNIAVLLASNLIGFYSASVCYVIGMGAGVISLSDPQFNAQAFKDWFFTGTIMTWMVCALFSLAFLFVRGKMRLLFLLLPAVVPYLYGFSVLFGGAPS